MSRTDISLLLLVLSVALRNGQLLRLENDCQQLVEATDLRETTQNIILHPVL